MPLDLETIARKLNKRGFKQSDMFLHKCEKCSEQAVVIFAIAGRSGGRDIQICQACGVSRSWRSVAGLETREEDTAFDLTAFLG
jgi:hypothetical protein